MKTYNELTRNEQARAISKAFDSVVKAVVEGALRFNDKLNHDDLQARIDKALAKADANQTPWFAAEIILEDSYVRDQLHSMALADAEGSLYSEPNEIVVNGVVEPKQTKEAQIL